MVVYAARSECVHYCPLSSLACIAWLGSLCFALPACLLACLFSRLLAYFISCLPVRLIVHLLVLLSEAFERQHDSLTSTITRGRSLKLISEPNETTSFESFRKPSKALDSIRKRSTAFESFRKPSTAVDSLRDLSKTFESIHAKAFGSQILFGHSWSDKTNT